MEQNRGKFGTAGEPAALSRKINELPLAIPGSDLEKLVEQLYRELESAGMSFRPGVYLSDSWGCPSDVPVIGIPFYLCRTELGEIVTEYTGAPAEKGPEIIYYLRHEAGHAFNYAFRLYLEPEWERTFGRWDKPYRERYQTHPFSLHFVRDVPGWYGQKHPDEDFAETFAVWLTPGSNWREVYAGTPALEKLLYVDSLARRYGKLTPPVTGGGLDRPIGELDATLGEWCRAYRENGSKIDLPGLIDLDLKRLFPAADGMPAAGIIETHRAQFVRDVHDWTGLDLALATALINELIRRIGTLELKTPPGEAELSRSSFAVFVTALAMNYQLTGEFMEK